MPGTLFDTRRSGGKSDRARRRDLTRLADSLRSLSDSALADIGFARADVEGAALTGSRIVARADGSHTADHDPLRKEKTRH